MFFLTIVTHERRPIFRQHRWRALLREAISAVHLRRPFEQRAVVLLPDHLHLLWSLPEGDTDYSTRIGQIKKRFTRAYLAAGGREGGSTPIRSSTGWS